MKKALQRRRNSESLLLLALKKVTDKISSESIPFRELKDKNVDRVALHHVKARTPQKEDLETWRYILVLNFGTCI